jgi:hypothetical protein
MTTRSIAIACVVAVAAIVAIGIAVVLSDTPAHDVKVDTPSSQPGPVAPQPTGGAR